MDEADTGVSPDAGAEMDATVEDAAVFDAGDPPRDAAPVVVDAQPADAGPVVPFVCNVKAPTACAEPAPRFADVQPIFTRRCAICHGQDWTGEWPLDTYSHIADWQEEIRSELVNCTMPPQDAGVPIPDDERAKILNWLRCGLPK